MSRSGTNLFPLHPFDPNTRINLLKSLLDETNLNYQHPRQHVNIKAAISMYGSGKLNGSNKIFIAGGKEITKEEALKSGPPIWGEVSAHVT